MPSPCRSISRRLARVLIAVAAVGTLSGCEAAVETRIEFLGGDAVAITATVTLHDELAAALDAAGGPDALRDLVARVTGVAADRVSVTSDLADVDGPDGPEPPRGTVAASVDLEYGELVTASRVIGVVSAVVGPAPAPNPSSARAVAIGVVTPVGLSTAIADAAAAAGTDTVDADSLVAAALGSLIVVVEVHFPGGVTDAWFTPAEPGVAPVPARDGSAVTLAQPLGQLVPGSLVVVGTPGSPSSAPVVLYVGLGSLAAVALAAALRHDRRRRR